MNCGLLTARSGDPDAMVKVSPLAGPGLLSRTA
jgi:hypothetical protein